jgi:acetoin utilization deacetylase AcuC-like enzyme
VLYFRHPSSLEHDPRLHMPEHPDIPERIEAVEGAFERAGWPGCDVREAPAASEEELELVHAPRLVESIRRMCESGGGMIDPDTFVGEASYRAALHAAGGACALARALVAGEAAVGFSAARPSGHHAERDRAMGFCLFNNIAVAAALAVAHLGLERVLIVDWDVHHGNGTAEIFRRRRDVLFVSIHQAGIYPGTGSAADAGSEDGLGYTINAPVPGGSGEAVWLSLLEHVIVPVAREFDPQLILISAGFDAHRADPLAGCLLETGSFAQMACHLRDLGTALGVPVGAVLEGGYDLHALGASALAMALALQGEGATLSVDSDPVVTPPIAARVKRYWSL